MIALQAQVGKTKFKLSPGVWPKSKQVCPPPVYIVKFREKNMLPVRTKYVPWFSPQLSCSQRDEPQPEHTMAQTEPPPRSKRDRRGKKRGNVNGEKTRGVLKVKLPKFNKDVTKQDKTPRKWMTEPAAKTTVKRRGEGAQWNVAITG